MRKICINLFSKTSKRIQQVRPISPRCRNLAAHRQANQNLNIHNQWFHNEKYKINQENGMIKIKGIEETQVVVVSCASPSIP